MLICIPVYFFPPSQSHFSVLTCAVHFISFCCAISYSLVFPSNLALCLDELTVVRSASLNYCTCSPTLYVTCVYYWCICTCMFATFDIMYHIFSNTVRVLSWHSWSSSVSECSTLQWSEIPALLGRWVTDTPSDKMLCPQENCLSLYFCKNITCLVSGFTLHTYSQSLLLSD